MSDPYAIILGMTNYSKYTWVCTGNCDALIEYTYKNGYILPNLITCPCNSICTLLSVEPATITPSTNEREQMETIEYLKAQIAELEDIKKRQNDALTTHQNCDYWKSENGRVQSQIIDVIDEIYAGNWTDEEDIANSLCQIIDYTPVKTVEFTATIRFNGRIDVPMSELSDFNLSDALADAYVDIHNGDVVIDEYDIEDAEEC